MSTNPDSTETIVMSASEVREHFSEVVNRVARGEGRVIVEKHGAPAVAVVSLQDVRRLRHSDDIVAERTKFVDGVRSHFADVPDDELERQIEKAFAEMKNERRRQREPAKTAS
ncbi:MAG TPA: type II toxin-antitoxin system Phd/YefM family antitoxin [Thermomicrobiales bacterium]|nr:type II toxin-antitoxin system Phd/YefM family antitoxin [Thermomicrobiales bacterium]